jgi:hypothetical protein
MELLPYLSNCSYIFNTENVNMCKDDTEKCLCQAKSDQEINLFSLSGKDFEHLRLWKKF